MMNTTEENPLSCTSPSVVTFSSQIDQNDLKEKSFGNPDWTIQRETSITIDKSINESTKNWKTKLQILSGILISLVLILSIILPITILTNYPLWLSTISYKTTTNAPVHNETKIKVEELFV